MFKIIGIRHEDKYEAERRVAIVPSQVSNLVKQGFEVRVEKSPKRVFADTEYASQGALLVDELKQCDVIFGVKEIPSKHLESNGTYVFFSHVIKGQSYNMPRLQKMIDLKCNLIDYERIVDDNNKRLIFFGRFAGIAGMINSLWSLGERLKAQGLETPFLRIKQSHTYSSLEEAKNVIAEVGKEISEKGLPAKISPLTIGFTGYGNVSQGAQEIAGLLPVKEISPDELLKLSNSENLSNFFVNKVVFKEKDLSEHKIFPAEFELTDYYTHPENYRSKFEQYIPSLTILMNCMYWDSRYPRIVTKAYLNHLYSQGEPKLKVIGDVTCDPDGSVEATHIGTPVENPVFVYNPFTEIPVDGFEGDGVLVMAVDILPSELPRESSLAFAHALDSFIADIALCDYSKPFEQLSLPNPIKKALILHNGELTEEYKYLEKYLSF